MELAVDTVADSHREDGYGDNDKRAKSEDRIDEEKQKGIAYLKEALEE